MAEQAEATSVAVDDFTAGLIRKYQEHQAAEPPQDAGMHPSMPVHEAVGADWAHWHAVGRSLRHLIGVRLASNAVDDYPHTEKQPKVSTDV